jgi:hypothetical protein
MEMVGMGMRMGWFAFYDSTIAETPIVSIDHQDGVRNRSDQEQKIRRNTPG